MVDVAAALLKVVYGDTTILDLIIVLMIYLVVALMAKAFSLNLRRSLKDKVDKDRVASLSKGINAIMWTIAIMVSLPLLGFNPTGLLVAGGFAAIVIGFASQSIVSNLISGVFLMFERPMKFGDLVEIDGVIGTVEDIKTLSTTIKKFDGMYVRLPNDKVFTSNITNFTYNVARRVEYTVGIRYSDDADRAVTVVKDLIEEHPLILVNPPPLVFVEELADSSVNLSIKFWAPIQDMEWWHIKQRFLQQIRAELEKNDIKVPFPQREVWFNDELVTRKGKAG